MKPSFFRKIKRAVRNEFRRIKEEHRITRKKRRRPPLSYRIRYNFNKFRKRILTRREKPRRPNRPPLSKRIRYYLQSKRQKYGILFSRDYLTITFNSTILYLLAFFLIHFLTHLVTGITAWFCEISTTLHYSLIDFHIRYYNWTEEMVILVFSIPAIFALIISVISSLALERQGTKLKILRSMRLLIRNLRHKQRGKERHKENIARMQQRIQTGLPEKRLKQRKRIPWKIRLFLLWIFYHSTTYFFSGMLLAFLIHRRFGYVIWYAFNSYLFDVFFTIAAFVSLLVIGYFFASQIFYSGRLYFNDLTNRNRMPFVFSQAIFPFMIGTIVTVVLQIPVFAPSLVLLNFSILFLLLPIPSLALRFDNIHFDSLQKKVTIYWKWVIVSLAIIFAIVVSLKTGIDIRLL